jgi:hypothetical protein
VIPSVPVRTQIRGSLPQELLTFPATLARRNVDCAMTLPAPWNFLMTPANTNYFQELVRSPKGLSLADPAVDFAPLPTWKTQNCYRSARLAWEGREPIIRRPPCPYPLTGKGASPTDAALRRRRRPHSTLRQWRLLHFVQLLIDEQREKSQQKYSGANTEHPHRNRELVDFR